MYLKDTPYQELKSSFLDYHQIQLFVKRDDLIHPEVSGNKWHKLRLNLEEAKKNNLDVLTFGGAYSNHIIATAFACEAEGIKCVGIIRGEELNEQSNSTLYRAFQRGMTLRFVSRADYKLKKLPEDISTSDYYVIPEGGANILGVQGVASSIDRSFDYIVCASGTGTTVAGYLSSKTSEKVVAIPALKGGEWLKDSILSFGGNAENLECWNDYHFGGYGKTNEVLFSFIKEVFTEYNLLLDPIYTAKAFYGLMDQIKHDKLNGARICFVHTGGLQGWNGIDKKYHPF